VPSGDLFSRRLLFVIGKGGVGKTTVAAALALEAVRRGSRTLLVEVDGVGRAAQFFGVEAKAPGEVEPIANSLFLMNVEGSAALAEYLMMTVPVKRVLRGVLNSRIYQYFVAAAPGLRELMTIGKIWYEAERTQPGGERAWDLVIVDSPATGHSLQYLAMPQAAFDTFSTGLVHREASRVVELLQDPERTGIVLVTTAEEMPVNETAETYRRLRRELHLPASLLVVNRVHQGALEPEDADGLAAQLGSAKRTAATRFAEEVLHRAREEVGWIAINRRYLQRLEKEVALPVIVLPFLFSEEFGRTEIDVLSGHLASVKRTSQPRGRSRATSRA
jgi:anion-transporting  ArsA/GET3 family ATPase